MIMNQAHFGLYTRTITSIQELTRRTQVCIYGQLHQYNYTASDVRWMFHVQKLFSTHSCIKFSCQLQTNRWAVVRGANLIGPAYQFVRSGRPGFDSRRGRFFKNLHLGYFWKRPARISAKIRLMTFCLEGVFILKSFVGIGARLCFWLYSLLLLRQSGAHFPDFGRFDPRCRNFQRKFRDKTAIYRAGVFHNIYNKATQQTPQQLRAIKLPQNMVKC